MLAILGLVALGVVASKKARPFIATVFRSGGTGFYSDATSIRNIYQIRFFNKRNQDATVTMRLGQGTPPGYQLSGEEQTFSVGPLGEISRTCVVIAPVAAYIGDSDIVLEVRADPGGVTIDKTVRFLGPNPESFKTPQP